MGFIKYNYDVSKYSFAKLIAEAFEVDDLTTLHKSRADLMPAEKLDFNTETRTKFHKTFYKRLDSKSGWSEMVDAYECFIREEVALRFEEDFVYQVFPSFRVHIPNDRAIHYWHYDTDTNHKHPDWEINFQIAITDMYDSNCTWVETVPGLKDFRPMEMKYGEYTIFNGNKCTHGNKVNKTGKMRVSFDFRVLPFSKYVSENQVKSATASRRFIVGDYYKLFKK